MTAKQVVAAIATVAVLSPVALYLHTDSQMNRTVSLAGTGRPTAGKGVNTLLVGSDSREGLTKTDRDRLKVGHEPTKRTDTMMVVHQGDEGTTLLSLPRDSWVEIPAFKGESGKQYPATWNKLNAAYAWGGAELLTATVEHNTGIRMNHYAEIGFKGFEEIVDSVGGVTIDVKRRIKDRNSGADFQAGAQRMNGAQALAYVRQRYQEARGDLGRNENQQEFLTALSNEIGPGNVLSALGPAMGSLEFDKEMDAWELGRLALAFKRQVTRVPMPIANMGYETDKGSAVLWDTERAADIFEDIKNDRKVTQ